MAGIGNIRLGRAIAAGVAGTVVMTAVGLWAAPMMGVPPMNPAKMLAGAMGGNLALGWMAHFMIGVGIAIAYAVVARSMPGAPAVRGALFALVPFLAVQVLVMPMMGMPVFSGSAALAMGSLVGHLMFGAVVGSLYGRSPVPARAG